MNISSIVATDKRTGKIVFAEGIEESNVEVQVIVPRDLFTESEIVKFKNDELPFPARYFNLTGDSLVLGDQKAYTFVTELENLKIELVEHKINADSLLKERDHQNTNEISGLFVIEKSTGDIIFAEGTDSDGYAYHQLSLGNKPELATDSDKDEDLKYCIGRDLEAKDVCGDYDNVVVEIRNFLIA